MLAGQLHPDAVFPNSGAKGREVAAAGRRRVSRWLELRFRTGFSEWLSHVYYDEDLVALLALVDFAGDPRSRRALRWSPTCCSSTWRSTTTGASSRRVTGVPTSAARSRRAKRAPPISAKLAFGVGSFARVENQSAVALALSPRYRVPAAIVRDRERPCATP